MYGKKKTALSSLLTFIITSLVIILAVGVVFKYTKAGDKIKDLFKETLFERTQASFILHSADKRKVI